MHPSTQLDRDLIFIERAITPHTKRDWHGAHLSRPHPLSTLTPRKCLESSSYWLKQRHFPWWLPAERVSNPSSDHAKMQICWINRLRLGVSEVYFDVGAMTSFMRFVSFWFLLCCSKGWVWLLSMFADAYGSVWSFRIVSFVPSDYFHDMLSWVQVDL